MLRLGVLDQSPVRSGDTPAAAIAETLELARAADRLGYHRYWLAEHHSTPALAGPSPEVLIPQVAAATSGIRVGSGGVMLQHYSALKVAESFRILETLYPGRIDLGIGRAPGSDQLTARALASGGQVGVDDFVEKVADVLGFLHGDLPPQHPFGGVLAMPTGPTAPEVWLLGSSDQSAALAAHFGLGFSFAHFINADGGAEVTRAYAYSLREQMIVDHARGRRIAGTPAQCRERLEALAGEYGADEVIVVTITESWPTRLRSYALLAEVFELAPRSEPGYR